ncbi:hypothetical protein P3T18_004784 [Paraburkholderia sp. GAS199]|uniref:DUF4148 domain-containing protein n=1 Tax=Paraburkholderia sp. GAS199 TaxID=3035126 RepID=UPI003D25616D
MKLLTAISLTTMTALGLTFGANAFAQSNPSGLTHAEVIAQLRQAQAAGLVPTPNNDYPPSASTVARNREVYAIQHHTDGRDGAHQVATRGMPASHPASSAD